MPALAHHIPFVPPSGIRALFEVALQMDDVAMLAVGEPDRTAAPHVVAAAQEAWERGDLRYAPNGGLAPLRDAMAQRMSAERGTTVTRDQVWVTIGGMHALHHALTLALGPGDEVLLPDPGYSTFIMSARIIGATPVPYPLCPDLGFVPDLAELAALVTPRTRAIIVNSPSNPLGTVLTRAQIEGLVDFAVAHDLWIVSDEVYEALTYGAEHVSPAAFPQADGRVLSIHSVSKTYAMTGIRVGFLITPPGLAATMGALQEATVSCVSPPNQYAALAAITGPQDSITADRERYASRLELARSVLDSRGIRYLTPQGAFYLWIDVSHVSGGDVAAWAMRLLTEHRVAVAPGSAFGATGEGWIRVCLAASEDELLRGLNALPAP